MKYPKKEMYEQLYKKYLTNTESIMSFVELAGKNLKGKRVLDLCCGTGILTPMLIDKEVSSIYMIDQETDMVPFKFLGEKNTEIKIIVLPMEEALKGFAYYGPNNFEIIYCRQAINYWFNQATAFLVSQVLVSGGCFIFNTFNECPEEVPLIKQYEINDELFTEISYFVPGGTIHHVQIKQGFAPHLTEFKWISPKEFTNILSSSFVIEKTVQGKTDYYKCIRK